ncbi:MAG: hypothetical protein WCI76_01585, partial [bacterium]
SSIIEASINLDSSFILNKLIFYDSVYAKGVLNKKEIDRVWREHISPILREYLRSEYQHNEIEKKMGRSREYVSNSLRILSLPEEILNGLSEGKITEGHTRPILMLADHPEEQLVLFKEIVYKKITVREAERLARKIAYDRVRKKEFMPDPEITELEEEFQDKLGTRVHIDRKESGGQIKIDYFSTEDLRAILDLIHKGENEKKMTDMMEKHIAQIEPEPKALSSALGSGEATLPEAPEDDRSKDEVKSDDADLYNISNFSV